MKDQKDIDEKAVKGRKAVSHDTKGGKHAMSGTNPVMPDSMTPPKPLFKGIRHIGD